MQSTGRRFKDSFATQRSLTVRGRSYRFFSLPALEAQGVVQLGRLPFSVRVLLENVLRNEDGERVTADHILSLCAAAGKGPQQEVPFLPARVLLQDFTGVPAVVDIAALRDAVLSLGGDPAAVNPVVPVDLVIDHSLQVDYSGTPDAAKKNMQKEFERNRERYLLLKWAQHSFRNFRVVPPGRGIVHQVNLEYLASVVRILRGSVFPDTVLGTDSHTTMINALGVLGWGVGGIEAEAVMLGQPYYLSLPEVVGLQLTGTLPEGATATDLVLTLTQLLRQHGVVGKYVEFFGPALSSLSLPDRATLANMAPEYGATAAYFPIDDATLEYLRATGRPADQAAVVESYAKEQGLFRSEQAGDPEYSRVIACPLDSVEPSVAGPRRPQDRHGLKEVKRRFFSSLTAPAHQGGFACESAPEDRKIPVVARGEKAELGHGSVVIAAITSCTNTSNPSVMLAAGLLARNAVARGLRTKPHVKTSLAPGSRVVTDYLSRAGLLQDLEQLGFHLVGYGCTTCIGNAGPLGEAVSEAIGRGSLVVAAVLSGNRNFEGRVHPEVRANYLASPPLVVAYALAGRIDIDFDSEPVGTDQAGQPVYLRDIWPPALEVRREQERCLDPDLFRQRYRRVFEGDGAWKALPVSASETFRWHPASTYIKPPSFFSSTSPSPPPLSDILNARVLVLLGDWVTTDHISPAGVIPEDGPAGQYLLSHNVPVANFNSFGSRRGNHEVMVRGTFANIRLRNLLVEGREGGWTVHFPSGEVVSIYEASLRYRRAHIPLIVIAGLGYGTGSSRDWAAKGTALLGVRAVLARSFERIHRSNLIGMGVLPLQFPEGASPATLGLTGREIYSVEGIAEELVPGKELYVTARNDQGRCTRFPVLCRVDTPREVEYYRHGGILQAVLRSLLHTKKE